MLRQERFEDPEEALRQALEGWQSGIWTCLPGILDSFDAEKMTAVVQPALRGIWRLKDGTTKIVTLPQCLDVPVSFPGGGGWTATFPMKKDDEGLLVFASKCIDAWWQSGGIQNQAELRMHDLSDGFFIPGVRSVPRVLADFNTDAAEMRNDAGDVKVIFGVGGDPEIDVIIKDDTFAKFKDGEIDLQSKPNTTVTMTDGEIVIQSKSGTSVTMTDKDIEMVAGGSSISVKDSEIDINSSTIKLNGLVWGTHEHTGVQTGTSKTGGPTAP